MLANMKPGGIRKTKQTPLPEAELVKGLTRAAMAGHSEACPLCGEVVVSVALHYLSCPKVAAEREPENPPR